MSKPLVGIAPNFKQVEGTTQYVLKPNYALIVSESGAIPVVLPLVGNRQEAREVLERLQGLVLTGGLDIDPSHYGQASRHPDMIAPRERTESDFAYAREAKDRGMPTLGICLGTQTMNVAFGGTLLQHIPDDVPGAADHEDGAEHTIRIEPGTVLARALGVESATVNSFHHQGIGDLAPGFRVAARSPDGIIEAIERPDLPFFVGVHWHPERIAASETTRRLLRAFVDATRGAWTPA
jgi:putative glutamine amidotransferase